MFKKNKFNKKWLIFLPIFILYIFIVELWIGAGVENNLVWESGTKWLKERTKVN